ncbi:tail fiber protein [Rhodoglobus sp. NPDC076762]
MFVSTRDASLRLSHVWILSLSSAPRTPSRSLRLFAGAAVAAVMLAGCTSQGSSADALQKACVDTTASAIKLIDAADSCGAGFVEAVFMTEAAAAGADGAAGIDGTNGINGTDGTAGANGLNGADGTNGINGADGATGARGLTGANGKQGPKGDTGNPGADGADGAVGPAGPQGPQGEIGAAGTQGIQGLTGATGATGAQGPAGNSLLAAKFGNNTGGAHDSRAVSCTLGTLTLTAATYAGEGLVADGRILPIANHTALFTLLGTTYGGNGTSTFALPNMSDVTPNGMTWMMCHEGSFPQML